MSKNKQSKHAKGSGPTAPSSDAPAAPQPAGGASKRQRGKGAKAGRPSSLLGVKAIALAAAMAVAALYINMVAPGLLRRLLAASPFGSKGDHLLFEKSTTVGNRTLGPSFGLYPRGCRWREVTYNGSKEVDYLYWDYSSRAWTAAQPAACRLQGAPRPGPKGWSFLNGSPRTEVKPFKTHVVYRNLWYNNGRWYALVDGPNHVASWRFSRNQEILTFHVDSARAFADSVQWRVVPGDTLLFDYIFFTHPTAIGHWWEMVAPLYSVLKRITFKRPCDTFVLLHLQRRHLPEWVRAMVAVALGVGTSQSLPPIILQEPTDNRQAQMTMRLEGIPPEQWVVFDTVLIVRDIFTGGSRTFANREDAHEFRAAVYAHYGLPPPARRPQFPRTITFQRKRANRRVINEKKMLDLLGQYGDVRVVEFNATSSLQEQLLAMRDTGLFVSAHTSNLANAPMLQPGSAVIEFIPRHWTWMNLDKSFKEQTAMMGDIHHWAWRANKPSDAVYVNPRDAVRFGQWGKQACHGSEDCVEAQTDTDLKVDLRALKGILETRVPMLVAGRSVKAAELPWPPEL